MTPDAKHQARPVAVIDIGSNTTRLLVAEKRGEGFRELLTQRAYTRLGRGVLPDGSISERKIDQLSRTIATQLKLAAAMDAREVRAMATAATRNASNSDDIVASIERRNKIEVSVLSEEQEARLAFLGATHRLPVDPTAEVAVIDIGGGSTELAVGSLAEGVRWSTSFRVGSAGLSDQHVHSDPPSAADLADARAAVVKKLEGFAFPEVDQAIAIGGTASSLRRLTGNLLEHETMERAIRLITSNPAEHVAEEFAIDRERVEVLPAGVMIMQEISDRLSLPLRIGKGGVREGKLLKLLM